MSSGMNHMGGLTPAAARPRTCTAHHHHAGTAAPIHAYVWLCGSKRMPVFPVSITDRHTPRHAERSP